MAGRADQVCVPTGRTPVHTVRGMCPLGAAAEPNAMETMGFPQVVASEMVTVGAVTLTSPLPLQMARQRAGACVMVMGALVSKAFAPAGFRTSDDCATTCSAVPRGCCG